MKFVKTPLKGAWIVEVEPFVDERGLFVRTFCQEELSKIGFCKQVVQINHSLTRGKGAIRGMHFQRPPAAEAKIIRCVQGKVFDVMVDIRAGSPSFLRWYGVELSKDNMRMVVIPEGFAHGFQTLTDDAELIYHHSASYSPGCECGLRWNDPVLAISWPLPAATLSEKDQGHPLIDSNFGGVEV